LHRAETLLKAFVPNLDLNDPNVTNGIAPNIPPPKPPPAQPNTTPPKITDSEKDSLLESMVKDTGSLDLDDEGHWDFHGHSSGMVFIQRLKQQFGDVWGSHEVHGSMLAKPKHFVPSPQVFVDSPRSSDSPMEPSGITHADLPPKEQGYLLCDLTMNDACSLMRFMHKPTFWNMFDKIYNTTPDQWSNEEHRYLPLLYALMAVGTMFAKDEDSQLQKEGYTSSLDNG
jgi:hypothetical protein